MKQLLLFLGKRAKCMVLGHRMKRSKVREPLAGSIVSGYMCHRCGKPQMLLYRWQRLED